MNERYKDCVCMIAKNWEIDSSDVPEVLARWCMFEQQHGAYCDVKLALLKPNIEYMKFWSDSPAFTGRFYPFTHYTDSYDTYAIWHDGSDKSLGEMPVVVLGDDGYLGVIADNLYALLPMLAFGYLDSARNDYKDNGIELKRYCLPLEWIAFEDDLPSNFHAFIEFIRSEFGLSPDPLPNESLLKAYRKHNSHFVQWCNQYLDWKIDDK